MAGPLPLPIEHSASSYGEEANIQRDIQSAAQYNPQTKLGITAGDGPSKKATGTIPSTEETLAGEKPAIGLGPKSGLEDGVPAQLPTVRPFAGPHSFTSFTLNEHKSHLGRLTNLSPETQAYLGGTSGG